MFGVSTAGMHPAPRPSRHSSSHDFDPVHVLCKCCDLCTWAILCNCKDLKVEDPFEEYHNDGSINI